MARFDQRSTETEIMDDLECSGAVLDRTLRELEIINKWLGGNAVTIGALSKLFNNLSKERTYHLVDVGCGGGDMAKHIYEWGKQHGFKFEVLGIDANANAVNFAKKHVCDIPSVSFRRMNIFESEFQDLQCDVVVGSLFYHHFTRAQLIGLFRSLKNHVSIGFIINDIHRHPLAYYSIRLLTHLFSKSTMVQHDAPTSVCRAFTKHELEDILRNAGYSNYRIRWKWAFRWQVVVSMR